MIKRFTFDADPPEGSGADRVVLCTVLPELTPGARHERVTIEWFSDAAALGPPGAAAGAVVVAEELVLRGADWLAARWRDGGPRLKHMALAHRADGLTAEAFSERWRGRAGQVGAVPIPEEARGLAYAQDHPVAGGWAYDAVNEVWFDDIGALRRRIEWMEANLAANEDDLVSASWFLAVREEVVAQ